jgi:aspartate/methionine/tyrosine aminotransferase
VTPGASGALQLATAVLLAPGEALLMADPGYPCNRHFARLVEARAVGVPVGPESGYQLTAAQVEAHWTVETAAALVASPSNPTGTVVERAEMAAIAEVVHRRGGRLLVDEIYNGLVYEGDVTTALAITDEAFVINSFSKYFGMTGWRIGWLVAPPAYVRDLEKLAQNLFISAPTPSQYAALAALRPETLAIAEARRQAFRERRDFLLPALRELGFRIPVTPQGAFYLYADISAFGSDSHRFAMDLLERAGVAVTPGLDFGSNAPERHVRFAYTTSLPRLEEAVARIGTYLESL